MKQERDSNSKLKFKGERPAVKPPKVEDFEEVVKKNIDSLVDSLKYIATICGVIIAVYSRILQDYLKDENLKLNSWSQLLLFSPLLIWFFAILGTVLGIFPRTYHAKTDLEKEKAIDRIQNTKRSWIIVVLYQFIIGFALFLYIIFAQIFRVYPFHNS